MVRAFRVVSKDIFHFLGVSLCPDLQAHVGFINIFQVCKSSVLRIRSKKTAMLFHNTSIKKKRNFAFDAAGVPARYINAR